MAQASWGKGSRPLAPCLHNICEGILEDTTTVLHRAPKIRKRDRLVNVLPVNQLERVEPGHCIAHTVCNPKNGEPRQQDYNGP